MTPIKDDCARLHYPEHVEHTDRNTAMNKRWKPLINRATCTGCGACVQRCPEGALEAIAGKAAVTQPQACTYCGLCETLCPARAIALPYLVVFADSSVSDAGIR